MSQRISPNHLIVCFFLLYKNPRLRVAIDNALSQTPEQLPNVEFARPKADFSHLKQFSLLSYFFPATQFAAAEATRRSIWDTVPTVLQRIPI